jgi:hypothetical protein
MARGPDERSDSQATQPESRLTKVGSLAKGHDDNLMVADGGDKGHATPRGRSLPVAFASQAAPCEGRTQYGLMYRCPVCSGTHFGRSPVQLVTGKRVARCGRMVWLVIARNYTSPGRGAAG